jgi:hypothetical protein
MASCQSEPGRQVPALCEGAPVVYRRQQGCSVDEAHAWDDGQTASLGVGAGQGSELLIVGLIRSSNAAHSLRRSPELRTY